MKRFILLFFLFLTLALTASSQSRLVTRKRTLNENTVVKDSSGITYPYAVWKNMMASGEYILKALDPKSDSTAFLLVKMSEAQKNKIYGGMSKPEESKFFTTGEKITSFNANDIQGNKIKLKDLIGKVVVLNFWFIGCPPCRKEIPELNRIALKYVNDPDVIFIAICLDDKYSIEQFIKTSPFAYHIIEDGRIYADLYKLHLYPTNVILDKDGKVKFHASGLSRNTPYWIEKTIEEAKQGTASL